MNELETINNFHNLYYNKEVWKNSNWMGINIQKCPLDLFIYQEILYEIRPDLIIETGTAAGGSAYYMAHICDILGGGNIITVDIGSNKFRPFHPRISYILGSSVDPTIIEKIKSNINSEGTVLVILDSDHSKDHVLKELNLYDKFVTKNSYMIVEDSNVNSHPAFPEHGPGPMEAIDEFLLTNKEFVIDSSREKFMMTFNPRGYLKKII